MPVQTTYTTEHAAAYEGMKTTVSGLINTRSYFAEGSIIVAGRAVVPGTDGDKQCALPSAGSVANDLLGVSLYELNRVHNNSNLPENQDRPISIVSLGELWVRAQNGAGVNDPVFVVINNAGGDPVGTFRSSADGANTIAWPALKFKSAAAAGALAKVTINI